MGYDTLQSPVGIFWWNTSETLSLSHETSVVPTSGRDEPNSEFSKSNPWVSYSNPRAIQLHYFQQILLEIAIAKSLYKEVWVHQWEWHSNIYSVSS